ncbi:MAG: hypothetical protein JWL75_776 [Parcubacteria group bacterium]|nr:hypothetical protein [Parcubacteria group bacterium]
MPVSAYLFIYQHLHMAKKLAVVFGVIFVLVGILGFVSNPLVGPTGLFQTDTLHNLVHLLIGVILLVVAMSAPAASALWLKIFGVIYLVLTVLGFLLIPSGGMLLGLVTMNTADHILHLVLGVVLIAASMMSNNSSSSSTMAM